MVITFDSTPFSVTRGTVDARVNSPRGSRVPFATRPSKEFDSRADAIPSEIFSLRRSVIVTRKAGPALDKEAPRSSYGTVREYTEDDFVPGGLVRGWSN